MFREWLMEEEAVAAFRQELDALIQSTRDPVLKAALERISADASPSARLATGAAQNDTFKELISCFKAKQEETGLPVLDVFGSLLAGRPAEFLIARFGRHSGDAARDIVVRAIEKFARQKNMTELVRLLHKFRDSSDAIHNPYRAQQGAKQPLQKGGTPQG